MTEGVGPLEYFACGGFGGICLVLVGHPFDTIKVRLQTMPKPAAGQSPLYTGMLDCIRKTISRDGPFGLYAGMGAPLATIAPIFAISFMGYRVGTMVVCKDQSKPTLMEHLLAGFMSGVFTTAITAPGERIKVLIQSQHGAGEKLYNGSLDALVKILKTGGVQSLFKGTLATLVRDVPASGAYYLTYNGIQELLTDRGRKPASTLGTLFAGGMSGITNWIVSMPSDIVKSRLQGAPEGTYPNGYRDVINDIVKKEGLLAFYKGITPVFVRAFPANAACFMGFEVARKVILHFKGGDLEKSK